MKNALKSEKLNFKFTPDTRRLLEKLSKINDRSMTNMLEVLIVKESREFGLIESRDK
jgi:hypothetical protein